MNINETVNKLKKKGAKGVLASVRSRTAFVLDRTASRLMSLVLPLKKNYIVMESEGDYTDNIRAFSDYMIAHGLTDKYKLIWIVHEPSKYPQYKNVEFVSRYGSFNPKADYYCAVSKFFLFSHPYWFGKLSAKQVVINTSHSVAQLKAPTAKQKKIPFDRLLICSPYCGRVKQRTFSISRDNMLCLGMPRIDILYRDNEFVKKLIPGYRDGMKIILSMETFKQAKAWTDSEDADAYALNVVRSEEELGQLDKYLQEHDILLVNKIHHLQDMSFIKAVRLSNIVYLSDDLLQRHDIQSNHLLSIADALLTDYSSVFYEYLLLDRPIGFLIGDMETYSRGFIMEDPLSEMPGAKLGSFDDLLRFVRDVSEGNDGFSRERAGIRKKSFSYYDDKNCERLYKWITKMRRK